MGARGPQATPTELLLARNSRKGKARAKSEPAIGEVSAPDCPAVLDPIGREEWDRVVPELLQRRTLTRLDMASLAVYCSQWSIYVRLLRRLDECGVTVDGVDGVEASPLVAQIGGVVDKLLKAADRFGMSPAAKARVKALDVVAEKKDNGKGRFFAESPLRLAE